VTAPPTGGTVRRALGDGLRALAVRPAVTGAALLAGAAGALAFDAAGAAFSHRADGHGLAAAGAWLLGATLGALLGASGLVAALAAPSGNRAITGAKPPLACGQGPSELPHRSLQRALPVLSLWAVEQLVAGTLLLAALAVALVFLERMANPTPLALAAAVTGAAAPALLLVALAIPAFRIGVAGTAEGLPSWLALARGFAVTLHHFPSVVGVGLAVLVASSPLWLLATALGRALGPQRGVALRAAIVAAQGALGLLAAAWSYAALAALARRLTAPSRIESEPTPPSA
jgi:hypothetical protein